MGRWSPLQNGLIYRETQPTSAKRWEKTNRQAVMFPSQAVASTTGWLYLDGTQLFCFSLAPWAWQLRGIYGGSRYAQMRVKIRVKWSKFL